MKWDVIIIGDGLAALSIARLLSVANYNVCVCTRVNKKLNIWFEHCSETFLNKLLLLYPEIDLASIFIPCVNYISAWSTSFSDNSRAHKGYNFDKNLLINSLKSISTQVSFLEYMLLDACIKQDDLSWKLKFRLDKNSTAEAESRWIVDASGRNSSWSAKYQTTRHYLDDHLAISQVYRYDDAPASPLFAIESTANGWWYSINVKDHVQLTFVTTASLEKPWDSKKIWDYNLQETYYAKGFMHNTTQLQGLYTQDARVGLVQNMAGTGWLALGDAAFTTDPLAGVGNEMVIDQVEDAFIYIHNTDDIKPDGYDHQYQSYFVNHIEKIAALYQMEKRWPHSSFWKR